MIVDIFRGYVRSYKQLPLNLYQIQWKFRDEVRPRFGVMRGREFLMKDAYSFDLTVEDAKREYAKMYDAYTRIFARMGLTTIAVNADSGAIGGNLSHEFQVIADTGESTLYYDAAFDDVRSGKLKLSGEAMRALYAAADEQHKPDTCPVPPERLRQARGIEVGHVFYLGNKYSKAMGVTVAGADGAAVIPEMGCYGIGVSRLVAAIIEASHDANGIIWPESVAPFDAVIINLRSGDEACDAACDKAYQALKRAGLNPMLDDTDERAGAKFASADLVGYPWQIVIGPRAAAAGTVELKYRRSGEKSEIAIDAAIAKIIENYHQKVQ